MMTIMELKKTEQQFFNQEELAKAWHCSTRVIGWLTKYSMLHPVRIGRSFVFNMTDINRMFDKYGGYDLSNEEKIRLAKQIGGKR